MGGDFEKVEDLTTADVRENYSETVVDHATNPRHLGIISNADAYASVTGSCGDNMEMWLRIKDRRLVEVTFLTDGCGTSIACGSMATELAKGKTIGEALAISPEVILKNLGGLPDESTHCAELASSTLKNVVMEHINCQREPWKRAYRRS